MRILGWWGAVLAATTLPGWAQGVAAQEVEHAPDRIRDCLCQEQSMADFNTEMLNQRKAYDDQRQLFQQLDQDVQTARPRLDVNDPNAVDAFKRLLDRRDAAQQAFSGDVTRNYADAVTRYNQAVTSYNASCAGKTYDADQLAAVRRNLSCPKP
jgi:uncharacterized protein YukE